MASPTQKRIAETFEQLRTEKSNEGEAVNWLGLATKCCPTRYPSHPCDQVAHANRLPLLENFRGEAVNVLWH